MKQGKTLDELAAELKAVSARKQDYIVDTRELKVLTTESGTELILPGQPEMKMRDHVHRQIGQHFKVRADFYDRLRTSHAPLFDHLINGLMERAPVENKGQEVRRMIRTLAPAEYGEQAVARAFLSDRYRRMDNDDLAEAVLPILGKIPNVRIESCELTDTRMYIKAVAPLTEVDLRDLITGEHKAGPADPVQAGVVISNSEVGVGSLSVQPMLYRLVCLNGMISAQALRKYHVGRKVDAAEDYSIYRDETLAADDRALMLKVQDAVTAAVDEVSFRQLATQFAETKLSAPVEKPIKAMEVLAEKVGLSEGERDSVLTHLLKGGDLTKFGTLNAVTRTAQDVESYDRATELEELGGQIMVMPKRDWEVIATAA
jgi:hypothetical protein